MLVERHAGREFLLQHVTRRVKAGTVLVCIPAIGKRLPARLKKQGYCRGVYCELEYWAGSKRHPRCMVRSVVLHKHDFVHFYPAGNYRLWRERVHRAEVKAIQEQLDALRLCHP